MNSKQKLTRTTPRLDRRNAIRNIDYEPPSSSCSSSSAEPSPSVRSRSLDLQTYYANQTSFRIQGIDGEIDQICQSLGLSGPDDFAISIAAWEARKVRSASDLLPRSRFHHLDTAPEQVVAVAVESKEEEKATEAQSTSSSSKEPGREREPQHQSRALVNITTTTAGTSSTTASTTSDSDKRGIKGVRPPFLTRPPSLLQAIKAFEPKNNSKCSLPLAPVLSRVGAGLGDGKDEVKEGVSNANEVERRVEREEVDGIRLAYQGSGSCSFSDSSNECNDDDSSSTTTDPTYGISPEAKLKKNIKSWEKADLLGSGSFGTVYEGFSEDGFFFAVKEVSLLDQGNQAKQSIYQLEQEISLLSQFEHENIVQYLGTDKDKEKLYIFLELVTKGSLAQLYQRYSLQDSQVSAYTRQILHGLKYLHDRKVVHRDVKCANILVDANGSVKLADFGLAKATKLNDVKSCKGTAFWMAPEVVRSRGYGLAADIWSLGCTVLEMLTRRLPYSPLECVQAMYRIGKGELPVVPNSLSRVARDFIHQCLQVKPDDRPTASQLLEHPFVKRPLSASSGSGSPSHPNWKRH